MHTAHQAYQEIGVTTDVMSATDYQLIQLLLDKSLQHVQIAKASVVNNNVPKKCYSIAKAMDIICYLRICLNKQDQSAQELAEMLDSLYSFSEKKLLEGNLKNDIGSLDQVINVITNIKSGWDGIKV